jgi:hypothetical protein
MTGSSAATAKERTRATGVSPSAAARSPLISSSAAAPSLIWLLLPAVMRQPISGYRLANDSS